MNRVALLDIPRICDATMIQLPDPRLLRPLNLEWETPENHYALEDPNQFQDDGKLDSLQKLSQPNQVEPWVDCCKGRGYFIHKESLENYPCKKAPANIEQLSSDMRHRIVLGVAQFLVSLQSLEQTIVHRDFKASNILLDGDPTSLSDFAATPNNSIAKVNDMDAGEADDSIALGIAEKTDMEIKNSRHELHGFGDRNETKKALKWWHQPSHLQKNWPNRKSKKESQSNVCHISLLIATVLSTITFFVALKIWECRFEEGCNDISSLRPICQIVIQHPYITRLIIVFNSIAFFLSISLLMILFNELPLRPLLLVSTSSMLGAYMCIISGLRNLS